MNGDHRYDISVRVLDPVTGIDRRRVRAIAASHATRKHIAVEAYADTPADFYKALETLAYSVASCEAGDVKWKKPLLLRIGLIARAIRSRIHLWKTRWLTWRGKIEP